MYRVLKRVIDFLFSLILLVVLLPVLLLVALVIRLDSRGPALFRQVRLGLGGRPFTIYKFRSMVLDAEGQGSGVYSFKGDGRVTRVGKFLRKSSIDELPQLLNIIRGEMSFIGPRPTLTYHPWPLEQYSAEQLKRFSIRPGISGWAQVSGRKDLLWEARIVLDVDYVNRLSFPFDFKIFCLTFKKVLMMKDHVNSARTVITSQKITEI